MSARSWCRAITKQMDAVPAQTTDEWGRFRKADEYAELDTISGLIVGHFVTPKWVILKHCVLCSHCDIGFG